MSRVPWRCSTATHRWTLLVVAVMLQMKLHTLLAIVEVTRLVLGEIDR